MLSLNHFESLQTPDASTVKIEYKDVVDRSNMCVESVVKVLKKDDSTLKFIINLYHTKSRAMVNGREVVLFNDEHILITDSILDHRI